jgi:hypothetical protein
MFSQTVPGGTVNLPRSIAAFLGLTLSATEAAAQTPVSAGEDTVVLIVKSPRGHEVAFSGTIVLKDAKTTRRFDNVMTPFEIRLAKQDIDARFTADDGLALNGELITFKRGTRQAHVSGTTYGGPLTLYAEPGVAVGFGSRTAARRGRLIP